MIRSLYVALREIRTYLLDKGDLAFSLLLPIVTFALMYGAFGGQTQFHGTAHVVNQDIGGAYSSLLLERLNELNELDVQLYSHSEADSKLDRSDLLMVLYVPAGFSGTISSGNQAQLLFKQRGNGGEEGQIVASIVRGVVEEIGQELQIKEQVAGALSGKGIEQAHIEITVQRFLDREREAPVVEVSDTAVGRSPDPVEQFLSGIIFMFVLFAITMSARSIVEERKNGTLERLLTTRLSVGQLFFGKYIASISRGFVQTFILLALSYAVFQVFTPLSFISALLIALVFAAAASALGMVIASVARSEDAATWIAVFITMAMVMIGGTFFPISEGTVLDSISKISISTYAIDAFKTMINQGGSLGDIGLDLGVLLGVAVVGLVLSRLLFKALPGGR
ncbi:ABC transporter permease [Chloroflexota bacterium]